MKFYTKFSSTISIIISFVVTHNSAAQFSSIRDSAFTKVFTGTEKRITLKSFSTPVSIFGYGVLVNAEDVLISDEKIKEERDEHFKNFQTHIDDYMQFAPIAAAYGMMIDHPEHQFWPFTKKVIVNELIIGLAVPRIKHLSRVSKPNTNVYNAFPSGHTAQAFSGATLLCDEFGKGKPWLYVTAYGSASAVGVLRVLNNRHWASDVIAGAGFGIFISETIGTYYSAFTQKITETTNLQKPIRSARPYRFKLNSNNENFICYYPVLFFAENISAKNNHQRLCAGWCIKRSIDWRISY